MVNLHRLINERNMTALGENIQKSASLMTLTFAHHEELAFIAGVPFYYAYFLGGGGFCYLRTLHRNHNQP